MATEFGCIVRWLGLPIMVAPEVGLMGAPANRKIGHSLGALAVALFADSASAHLTTPAVCQARVGLPAHQSDCTAMESSQIADTAGCAVTILRFLFAIFLSRNRNGLEKSGQAHILRGTPQ